MARKWTDAQKTAIEARDRTLLVSAAAGSGKTAVLTERIIRMLTDPEHPMDISRMLVVTFTRAAAGELRARIAKALSDAIALSPQKEHLSRQLMLLSGASISTIDSFYYDLVRANFQQAGFSASIRLADETELLGLRRELMNDVVDEMHTQNADFSLVSDTLCDLRSEGGLTDTLLSIYNKLLRYPEALDILSRSADKMETIVDPLDTPWGAIWIEEVRRLSRTGQRLFASALDMAAAEPNADKLVKRYKAHFNEHLERHRTILEHLDNGDYEKTREAIAAPFVIRKPGGRCPERTPAFIDAMELCDFFREKWKEKHAERLSAFCAEEVAQSGTDSARVLRLLHATLARFESLYRAAKLQREIAEFSDISRAAYNLLVDKDGNATALAADVRAKYDAIFIDEYQDVDSMQDATFRAIATEKNRFMVGDIKQSIYRFRGAQPKVFADYRRNFKSIDVAAPGDPASIFMSNCFRCDKSVIDFSNTVSGDLFSQNAESIGYTKEDDLVYSKDPAFAADARQKCRVVLINRAKFDKSEEKEENGEEAKPSKTEAIWIACEIARLLKEERKADGTRILPGDIAVLMRNATHTEEIARRLGELGIPCNDTSRKSFFENPDVLCVYSLLAALDNPYRDVYMAAALRSPFFGFTLEDLVRLHAANAGELSLYEAVTNAAKTAADDSPFSVRLRSFEKRFAQWREKAKTLPVDRLLRYLYRESAILSFAGRTDDAGNTSTARRANLQRLYEYARTFEQSSFKGLYQFVRYVDGIMESKGKMPAPDGEENAVSLITVHHSKGLEFPVCFIAGTATRFNDKDLSEHFMDEEELGCAIRLPNAGPFSRSNTFQREAVALRLRRFALEEEMRVLYVAMTRAKERLYVTADSPYGAKHLLDRATLAAVEGGKFVCEQGPAYIYWILSALMRTNHASFATIETVEEANVSIEHLLNAARAESEENALEESEAIEKLKERFAFVYPAKHLSRLPAKLSVSRLSPGVLDVYDTDSTTMEQMNKELDQLLHDFELSPSFLSPEQKKGAAASGTATHEFLQFCDFARTEKHGIAKELDRLIEEKFLPAETRELVREDELTKFFQSDFYRSLKGATSLRRETRFHIFLPASNFTQHEELAVALSEEKLAVQGVIDLFYYDAEGKLILCDYKTDRLNARELADPRLAGAKLSERHAAQLSYYAQALEAICGKHPDKILIYSLPLGEAVEVKI